MQISESLSLYSSLLSGTLPCIFKLPWPLWTLSPQLQAAVIFLGFPPLHHIPESTSRQETVLIVGFTLSVSFLSGITVLCCLLYNVCSSCFTHCVQFSSCLQWKYKSVISYSIAARRGSHSASISVKRIPSLWGDITFLISYLPFMKKGSLSYFCFHRNHQLDTLLRYLALANGSTTHRGISLGKAAFWKRHHSSGLYSLSDRLTAVLWWGPLGPELSITISEEFFTSGDYDNGMRTNCK